MALMFEFIEILHHIRNGDGTEFGANSFLDVQDRPLTIAKVLALCSNKPDQRGCALIIS